ncbi:hypothetical protein JGS39_24075 [Streptomyces sp. P01-B04]|uniref:hypothetical protein n=1 Tax=Streptomyces poriferorum TaxID=2798799 RepID=UPI001C5EEA51|nr:hypothetical protein [Streptomyces poriferorum]MBW5252040.1 hypothetical protein [Streptomyces poriferorum]MBW5260210.1 hypothetical protein [Streptomyces poriferorum]
MAHIDALDGLEIEGKAIILNTTEGPELVSWDKLDVHADVDAVAQGLTGLQTSMEAELAMLRARVEELEDQARAAGADKTEAPAKASTSKAAAK